MGKKSRHYRANHGVKRRPMVTGLDNQLLLIARNGSVPIKNKLPPPPKKGLLVFVSYHFCFSRPPENPVIKQNSVPSESDSVRTPKKWNQKKKKKRKTRSCKENVDEARRFASNVDVRTEESSMAKKNKTKKNKRKTEICGAALRRAFIGRRSMLPRRRRRLWSSVTNQLLSLLAASPRHSSHVPVTTTTTTTTTATTAKTSVKLGKNRTRRAWSPAFLS